jgi:hypothetical protein
MLFLEISYYSNSKVVFELSGAVVDSLHHCYVDSPCGTVVRSVFINILFNDDFSSSDNVAWILGWFVSDELEKMCTKFAEALFEVLYQNFSGGTERNCENFGEDGRCPGQVMITGLLI